jgi:hypothetical protein
MIDEILGTYSKRKATLMEDLRLAEAALLSRFQKLTWPASFETGAECSGGLRMDRPSEHTIRFLCDKCSPPKVWRFNIRQMATELLAQLPRTELVDREHLKDGLKDIGLDASIRREHSHSPDDGQGVDWFDITCRIRGDLRDMLQSEFIRFFKYRRRLKKIIAPRTVEEEVEEIG